MVIDLGVQKLNDILIAVANKAIPVQEEVKQWNKSQLRAWVLKITHIVLEKKKALARWKAIGQVDLMMSFTLPNFVWKDKYLYRFIYTISSETYWIIGSKCDLFHPQVYYWVLGGGMLGLLMFVCFF